MRIILTLDLPDLALLECGLDPLNDPAATCEDLAATMRARLDEVYPGNGLDVVPERVHVAVGTPQAVQALLDAARVGLDGDLPDDVPGDEAFALLTALDSPE